MSDDGTNDRLAQNRAFMAKRDPEFVQLAERAFAGDPEAIDEFVNRYAATVRRLARLHLERTQLRPLLDPGDIAQSV